MLILYILFYSGCDTVSEGSFLDDVAAATCDHAQECDPEAFDAEWDNYDACIDEALVLATCESECCTGFEVNLTEDGVQAVRDADCDTPASMMFEAFPGVYEQCDLACLTKNCHDYINEFGW